VRPVFVRDVDMKRLFCAALAAMLLFLPACREETPPAPTTTAAPLTTPVDVTAAPITVAPMPETTAPETEPPTAETTLFVDTTAAPETTAPETEPTIPQPTPFVNPLTGLPTANDLSQQRPAAVMINNLRVACPQIGIAQADVLYECLVEGGITRLMAVISDYTSIGTLGSVRSSRDYYIDMAQDHDALYIHAGGSPQAYEQLYNRGINYICGVNMYTPNTFYRDLNRQITMGYEHSLMTNGEGLRSGIAYKGYRTTIKDGFVSPFVFDAETNSAKTGSEAKHLILNYSAYAIAQMIYSESTNTYYRFQFGDQPHIDGATGEQLSFTNVLILYQAVSAIPGDTYGRLAVETTGTGKGYYVSGGRSIPIVWSKETRDSVIRLTTEAGEQLVMTPGKTFVSILPLTAEATTVLNHK